MNICNYKYALGVPNEGIHATRLGPFALWDVVGTLALAGGIAYMTPAYQTHEYSYALVFVYVLMIILIVATALHWVFCVPTAGMRLLGVQPVNQNFVNYGT